MGELNFSKSFFLPQPKLPKSVPSKRLSGLQPAVNQLGARPSLHLWVEQRPVGQAADAEGANEGHKGAEAAAARRAQSQGPLQHSQRAQIRPAVCQRGPR